MSSTSLGETRGAIAVPPEILEHIFDDLEPESQYSSHIHNATFRRDMQTCCLVSKAWLPLGRSRLFKEVEIGSWAVNAPRRRRLAHVIMNQPSIGAFIRMITYSEPPGYNKETEGREEFLYSFLGLPNVRTLFISSHEQQDYGKSSLHYFGWRLLLDHYLSAGQLTSIKLGGIKNLPLLSIISSPLLKDLILINTSISDLTGNSIAPSIPVPKEARLTSFEARNVTNLWWPILATVCPQLRRINLSTMTPWQKEDTGFHLMPDSAFPFPRVTSLHLSGIDCCRYLGGSSQAMFPAVTAMHISPPFLETDGMMHSLPLFLGLQTLRLTVTRSDYSSSSGSFDWDILAKLVDATVKSLTHLGLDVSMAHSSKNFLTKLSAILANVKQKNVLQSLSLVLEDNANYQQALAPPSQILWKGLADTLVSNRSHFSCLHDVYIEYHIEDEIGFSLEEGVEDKILGDPMKELTTCPDINFDYCVHVDYF